MSDFSEWPEFRWCERPQWCNHCYADVTVFGHQPDCPDYVELIEPADVERRIAEAVAAEREALLEALFPIYDLMYVKDGVDWHCRLCGGYNYTKETLVHGMTCPMGRAQTAIRARAGKGEQTPMSDNQNCGT